MCVPVTASATSLQTVDCWNLNFDFPAKVPLTHLARHLTIQVAWVRMTDTHVLVLGTWATLSLPVSWSHYPSRGKGKSTSV